ncbi:MAG: phosphatidylglycerophosphatase A [Planktomarina sp.]
MKGLAILTATVCYVGYIRPAPGTWGSLAGLGIAAILLAIHPALFFIAIPATIIKGWWATKIMTAGEADHDRSEIVIDEVAGQMIALLPVVLGALHVGASPFALYPGWIAAFIFFRLFDIVKIGPVGWADRMETPFGVILDDIIAGIMAAISVAALAGIVHALMV